MAAVDPLLTGSVEEWNEAYYRLEDYFRAHLCLDEMHRNRLVLDILEHAAIRHAQTPVVPPVTIAMQEATQRMTQWFRMLLPENVPVDRFVVAGRIALLMTDATRRWPKCFLNPGAIPDGLLNGMQRTTLQPTPHLHVSSMVPKNDEDEPASNIESLRGLEQLSVPILIGVAILLSTGVVLILKQIGL